jgi:hypothetical protein
MNRLIILALACAFFSACKPSVPATPEVAVEITDLAVLADQVPKEGPREGNNYKVFFKMQQTNNPAVGFKIDAWVKGKSEPKTLVTDNNGIVKFTDLPFPDATHKLNATFHYFRNGNDQSRSIEYPFIEPDAYRMKDTQYIPNDATPQ